MADMDLWQCMDYIVEFANNETKAYDQAESGGDFSKKASQSDFDNF